MYSNGSHARQAASAREPTMCFNSKQVSFAIMQLVIGARCKVRGLLQPAGQQLLKGERRFNLFDCFGWVQLRAIAC
jgi:hypothetical protein